MTPRLLINTRRAILFTAASLLLTCPLAARATPPQTGEPTPGGRSIKRPGRIKKLGVNVLDFLSCKTANARLKRELLAYGPQFPQRYDPSDFSFKALVNADWQMGVDYELERGATVVMTIRVMGAAPFTEEIIGEGIGRRLAARFTLPSYRINSEQGPYPALISFKATRPGPSGEERAEFILRGAGAGASEDIFAWGPRGPAGVEVAALGPLPRGAGRSEGLTAGRPATTPLRLSEVRLDPGPRNDYVYSFKVNGGRFNRWRADILRMIPKSTHQERETLLTAAFKEQPIPIVPGTPVRGIWDGHKGKRRVRPGEYTVRVMASVSERKNGAWTVVQDGKPIPIN